MRFEESGLDMRIIRACQDMGYQELLPVQEQCVPAILNEKDCFIHACTGSGKTAAYAMPILSNITENERHPQVLVLSPTRELCNQITEEMIAIGAYKRVKVLSLYGQTSYHFQKEDLKQRVHALVCTAGRLIEHLQEGNVPCDKIKYLVLDEADEMLGEHFLEDVSLIQSFLPKDVVTILASATWNAEVKRVSRELLHNPIFIQEKSEKPDIVEYANVVEAVDKYDTLCRFFMDQKPVSCIVFCQEKATVKSIYEQLNQEGLAVGQMHSDMEQEQRTMTMQQFKSGQYRFLIATDVAARGLDIEKVEWIVNYDIPSSFAIYKHRIGRSGRLSNRGYALSFVEKHQTQRFNGWQKEFDSLSIPMVDIDLSVVHGGTRIIEDKKATIQEHRVRLHINVGKNKKIRPGDIVGALCSIEGIKMDDIGIIQVQAYQTYVEIWNGKEDLVLKGLKRIKKKPVKVEYSEG